MKELIKIGQSEIGVELVNSVNSRELHVALEVKKPYSDWMKQQIGSLGLEENVDYIFASLKSEAKSGRGGHNAKDYIITTDTAKHISMASRTPKGKKVRRYFIEVEKQVSSVDARLNKLELAVGVMSESMKLIAGSIQAISENLSRPTTKVFRAKVALNPRLSDNKKRKEEFIRNIIDILNDFEEGISQKALLHRTEFTNSSTSTRWLHEGVGIYWDMYFTGRGYRYIPRADMKDINQ